MLKHGPDPLGTGSADSLAGEGDAGVVQPDAQPFPNHGPLRSWAQRNALWLIALSPVAAQLVATVFNILYNHFQIEPLLSENQTGRFFLTVFFYNAIVYSVVGVYWISLPLSLGKSYRAAARGEADTESARFKRDQRRAINLPWGFGIICLISWLMLIPVFIISLCCTDDPLDYRVLIHLPISFIVAGLIGTTHGFFNVEFFAQRWLFPVFFRDSSPSNVSGAVPLTLFGRSIVWVVSAVVCPVISILLLFIAPGKNEHLQNFAVGVGVVAVLFGIATAVMFYYWISSPLKLMQKAAHDVGEGNLDARIDLLRADEFGPMIEEFNDMAAGLREKERIRETFGQHVGHDAALKILSEDPGLLGQEQVITVMFADVRGFTSRSERITPVETVRILNVLMTRMVYVIESNGGMVNKFLGDGLMALFGATEKSDNHCEQAVRAGQQMLESMNEINSELELPESDHLKIGVGVHSGPAVVGSIGAPSRRDFTAIGDTVNVASRVESLTKEVGVELLFTAATRAGLSETANVRQLPSRPVKGKADPIEIFTIPS